jgi:hypothetical protein
MQTLQQGTAIEASGFNLAERHKAEMRALDQPSISL